MNKSQVYHFQTDTQLHMQFVRLCLFWFLCHGFLRLAFSVRLTFAMNKKKTEENIIIITRGVKCL